MRTRLMPFAMLMLTLGLAAPAIAQQKPLREPDVIFVPTPAEVVTAMLKLANVSAKDLVYDLGCGDGMIVTAAAKEFGAHYEKDSSDVRFRSAGGLFGFLAAVNEEVEGTYWFSLGLIFAVVYW